MVSGVTRSFTSFRMTKGGINHIAKAESGLRSAMAEYFVYIMSNVTGMLYTGVTNNLERRVFEHKTKLVPGFTSKYNLTQLVYYESTDSIDVAISMEKQIKGWLRKRKVALIETMNPEWKDLSEEWMPEDTINSFVILKERSD